MDIDTIAWLTNFLKSSKKTVLFITHDRYFLDKVADKLLVFQGNGKQELYYGNMSSYLLKQKELQQPAEKVKPKTQSKEPAGKKKLSYMEQKEWETIEEDIAELEEKISLLQEEMNHQGDDFTRLQELQNDVSETEAQLEEKMARWEYLSEWAED